MMTTEQLILVAVVLWFLGALAASVIVFSALYVGDDDRHVFPPGDITGADVGSRALLPRPVVPSPQPLPSATPILRSAEQGAALAAYQDWPEDEGAALAAYQDWPEDD